MPPAEVDDQGAVVGDGDGGGADGGDGRQPVGGLRVEQDVVVLEGTVPSDAALTRAMDVARETPGVIEVQSRLVVLPRGGGP